MKKYIYIFLAILVIGGGVFLILNKNDNKTTETVSITKQISDANGQLIDVRTIEEYTESHADDAINIPIDDILNNDFSKIDKEKPIYVYCRSGNRSNQAKVALEKAGYTNITDLGGLSELEDKGVIVCKTTEPSC